MKRLGTMMYLAAAGALYAWRRSRSRAAGHGAVGITGLPADAERAQQESLPPRGTRAGDYHA